VRVRVRRRRAQRCSLKVRRTMSTHAFLRLASRALTTSSSSSFSFASSSSHARSFASASTSAPAKRDGDGGGDGALDDKSHASRAIYTAALADTVRKVKLLSLGSLAATAVGCPMFLELSQPEMAFEAKAAVSATVISFGGFTTALLQWFISPYVKTMVIDDRGTVKATKFAWNASTYETSFAKSDMVETESSRPLVSWEAKDGYYYVEMGGVPKEMYDELDLARFDSQAKAEAAAKNMEEEDD